MGVRFNRLNAVALALACLGAASLAGGQQANAPAAAKMKPPVRIIYYTPHVTIPEEARAALKSGAGASTIPLWNYTTKAYDTKTYSGSMVGRSPFAHGHRSTTINTVVVPVILKIKNSSTGMTETFDPTAADACAPNNDSVVTLLLNSPIFQNSSFTMNGSNVGNTQYLDAFQRGNFFSLILGTPYHTVFTNNPTVLPAITVTVPTASGDAVSFGGCRDLGLMDFNFIDPLLQSTIIPSLAAVNPTVFPQFLFDSVGMTNGAPVIGNCCILGYHNAYFPGGTLQTYSTNDYDTSGAFNNSNTGVLSHEVAEWMDDPKINNLTPVWGNEGQVDGTCQGNLEVGDPLSPGFPDSTTNPFSVTLSGVTYTLQELAFYSWFIGDTPSLGVGGGYSDNGTFHGHAIICPPGGTN